MNSKNPYFYLQIKQIKRYFVCDFETYVYVNWTVDFIATLKDTDLNTPAMDCESGCLCCEWAHEAVWEALCWTRWPPLSPTDRQVATRGRDAECIMSALLWDRWAERWTHLVMSGNSTRLGKITMMLTHRWNESLKASSCV